MAKKKNWVLIVVGIVIFVVIVGIAAVVGGIYYIVHQTGFSTKTGANVEQEFNDARARFEGQVPYVEVSHVESGEARVHHELEKTERTQLKDLRVMVYDGREKRLVSLALPFWLLRLGGNKPINLRSGGSGFDPGVRLTITTEDLERRGKGLVLDAEGRRGQKVLIWAE